MPTVYRLDDLAHLRYFIPTVYRLDDLAHAAYQGTITCQRTIASIFLDLAFSRDIRVQITSRNIPGKIKTVFIALMLHMHRI